MANISITDLRAKYITNFRNKVTNSTLGTPLYHKSIATRYMNALELKVLPNGFDNFPIINSARDINPGSTISVNNFNLLMHETLSFFGSIRKFKYGLRGNDGDFISHGVGFIEPTVNNVWRLNATAFPEVAGLSKNSNNDILKIRMTAASAKLNNKELKLSDITAWCEEMAATVISAALSAVSTTTSSTDWPDLRVCHGSCHSSCHSSCHTSCHTSCHSSAPPPTTAPPWNPNPTTAPPNTPAPTTRPPSTPAPTTAPPWTPPPTPAPTQPPPPPNPLTSPGSVSIYGYNRRNTMGNGMASFSLGAGGSWSAGASGVVDRAIFPSSSGRWVNSGYSGSDFEVYYSGGATVNGNLPMGGWYSLAGGLSLTIRNEDAANYTDYIGISIRQRSNPGNSMSLTLVVSFESNM